MPHSTPNVSPGSVRTPLVILSCPMCGQPLQGKQTVCSAKCRIKRSRQRRGQALAERDSKVRLLLKDALQLLEEANL